MNYVTVAVLASFCISYSEAILCYQCANSINNADSHCIRGIKDMAKERYEHQTDGEPLNDLPYLKNCSHYSTNGKPKYEFCKIENIHSHGTVNAYIRDCADGHDFSNLNVSRLDYAKPDNQSICGFSQLQGATICVSLCNTDFCNGPLSGASLLVVPGPLLAILMTVTFLFRH